MEEEVLDYSDHLLEGQQIWINPLLSRPNNTLDSRIIYPLESHVRFLNPRSDFKPNKIVLKTEIKINFLNFMTPNTLGS